MKLTVSSAKKLHGQIKLPSSKSYSIRAFLIAAAGGASLITDPSDCDDSRIAWTIAAALGAKVRWLKTNICRVKGAIRPPAQNHFQVGESGTVLRLLLPILSLYSAGFMVEGKGTLEGRPNRSLVETLKKMGVVIFGQGEKHSIPIQLFGGKMKGGHIAIDGSLSSQFISALLIACPRLKDDTMLEVTGEQMVSSDYIDMTLQMLKRSGIIVERVSERIFKINGNQTFQGLGEFTVPADYGLAAFHMAAAALIPSDVVLTGYFNDELVQADGAVLELFAKMGVEFKKKADRITLKGPCVIRGGEFSLKDCPDLVPIVTVLALFADKKVRLYDIEHVRAKESDRISDLRTELLKVGANIEESRNELIVHPQKEYKKGVNLDPHHDHRLAMAFAVLGAKIGVAIKDVECTSKSYPKFVRDFQKIGVRVRKSK